MVKKPKLCPHGVLGLIKCKQCKKEWHRTWYKKNKAKIAQYLQIWRDKNREKITKYNQEWEKRHRKQNIEKTKRLRTKDGTDLTRKKDRAHNVGRYGRCTLANECELCPTEDKHLKNLQHHHPDYNYPEIYVTTCPSCHSFADRTTREIEK